MALTRRDLVVAAIAVTGTVLAGPVVRSAPAVMHSSTFDWTAMTAEPTSVGQVRHVFRTATATLEELECHITTLMPGQSPHPQHTHPNEEVIVVREGTLEVYQGEKTTRVGPGSVIFEGSNEPHSVKNVGDVPAVYHVFNWRSGATPKAAEPSAARSKQ